MRDNLNGKGKELLMQDILEKVRHRTRDVYGPLARMWSYLEEINSSRDKTVDVDIDTLSTCTRKAVLLLGQTINSLLYHHRCQLIDTEEIPKIGDLPSPSVR